MADRPHDPDPGSSRLEIGVVVALTLLAAATRAAFLNQPMRQDEADTVVQFALTPWLQIATDTTIPNNHLLHSALVKVSIAVFGNHPWAVRLPVYLAGVAAVPLTYLVGRTLSASAAGFIGAGLVAVSTPMVLYSTNARGYALIVVATLLLVRIMSLQLREPTRKRWVWFSLIAAAGFMVNLSMLYPFGGVAIWGILGTWRDRERRASGLRDLIIACSAAAALTLIAYLPAIKVSGWESLVANNYVRPLEWSVFATRTREFLVGLLASWTVGWPVVATGLALLCLIAAVVPLRARRGEVGALTLLMLLWAMALLVLTRHPPFYRVWLYLLPVVALMIGEGLARVLARLWPENRRTLATAAIALLIGAGAGTGVVLSRSPDRLTETGVFPDAERVAQRLAGLLRPGDAVAALFRARGPVDYYLRRSGVQARFLNDRDTVRSRLFIVTAPGLGETPAKVVATRKLRGVAMDGAQLVDSFPHATIWSIADSLPASKGMLIAPDARRDAR